ncbi:hypothetical protein U8Q06_34930 (plasmid) [Rhizobium beringeri]|uniref:hypothetical protein n=1 Tax=Rhizobium beringeri TaxID=3019934 RepID=UPI002E152E09|nr:hypothetical protein U8Q06_34930 [Rhizobium beringeri]
MVSSVSLFSSSQVLTLLGAGNTSSANAAVAPSTSQKLLAAATGNTDDVLKAGNAIGKIIEIVAGMNQSDQVFDMVGAERVYNDEGGFTETKTGQGTFGGDAAAQASALDYFREQANGTGPEADRAKAYLDAYDKGTIRKYDMSSMGVTSTATITKSYYADGTQSGEGGSFQTVGMAEFLKQYTTVGDDGLLRDKATGKYAGIEQNGTKFTYSVY